MTSDGFLTGIVLGDVARERLRQEEMKLAGRFMFTCAEEGLTNAEKLAVLVEEVGEVARDVLNQEDRHLCTHDVVSTPEKLREELIQVAAVAVAGAEALTTPDQPMHSSLRMDWANFGKEQICSN